MDMIHLPSDFKEFLRLLGKHHVKYLLIGGYAVGYHGYPHATIDMDIWIEQTSVNAEKTIDALREFDFAEPELTVDVLMEEDRMLRMGVPPLCLEIITAISGVSFEDCYKHRVRARTDKGDIFIISLSDLKKNKKAVGRNKDLTDLDHLP